jgi:hypothetical protein
MDFFIFRMFIAEKYLKRLKGLLKPYKITLTVDENRLTFSSENKKIDLVIFKEEDEGEFPGATIPFDVFITGMEKVTAVIRSRLGLNRTIFARKTEIKKISKTSAEDFLNGYHLMGATGSAFNYGLFSGAELVGVAAFSKGRKMDRLPDDKRSFELIRFCTRAGFTVSGGLSKLLKHFIREKQPGDIMTYVDKQFADGNSLIKMGFKKLGETDPVYFKVDKKNFTRQVISKLEKVDQKKYYRTKNNGNLKLVLTIDAM